MSNIIPFPQKPRVDCYFGGCPECGSTSGYLNVGKNHWFICTTHQTKWCVGYNLFSDWQDETQEKWHAHSWRLETFREVEPLPCDEFGGGNG